MTDQTRHENNSDSDNNHNRVCNDIKILNNKLDKLTEALKELGERVDCPETLSVNSAAPENKLITPN